MELLKSIYEKIYFGIYFVQKILGKRKKLSPASAFAQLHSDNYYFKILTGKNFFSVGSLGVVNIENKLMLHFLPLSDFLASIYLLNVNNGNTRSECKYAQRND